eukprot:4395995-Prymnesium_polylepis.1
MGSESSPTRLDVAKSKANHRRTIARPKGTIRTTSVPGKVAETTRREMYAASSTAQRCAHTRPRQVWEGRGGGHGRRWRSRCGPVG